MERQTKVTEDDLKKFAEDLASPEPGRPVQKTEEEPKERRENDLETL